MIGFRADANEKIASGHIMRCLSLAEEFIRQGEECIFFLAEDRETYRLRERGIPYEILGSQWDDLDAEREIMSRVLRERKLDWLVVDSYQATAEYLSFLESQVRVLYFDDMTREVYPVSAILNYDSTPENREIHKRYEETPTLLLCGWEYIPLRREFAEVSEESRQKSILITTGGTDPFEAAAAILQSCLPERDFDGYRFDVIVGGLNHNEAKLRHLAEDTDRIRLHKNVTNMSEYMRRCEMAVSAGGTTLYELFACRTPSVCFSFAENQKKGIARLDREQIALYAGDARESADIGRNVCSCLQRLMDKSLQKKMQANMAAVIDGRGCERIVAALRGNL